MSEVLLILLLTLLGGWPRWLALRHSLWYDELWTLEFMRTPAWAVTHQSGYNNHLLNSLLGSLCWHVWANGTHYAGNPNLALPTPSWVVRLPAFVFGVASIPMLYACLRSTLGRQVAATAALLLALSPVGVDLSTQTRGYSSLVFFALAQTYCLQVALRTGRARAWLGWAVLAALGTWAHLYFLFVIGVNALFVAGWLLTGLRVREQWVGIGRRLIQGIVAFVLWAGLSGAAYAGVWRLVRAELQRQAGMLPMARAHDVMLPLLQLWGGAPTGDLYRDYVAATALGIGAGIAFLLWKRSSVLPYVGLLLVVPPLLVERARPHFVYPRFFSFAHPAFLVLIACGCVLLANLLVGSNPRRGWLRGLAGGLLALMFSATTANGLLQTVGLPKQDYGAASRAALLRSQQTGWPIAAIGTGAEFFRLFGVPALLPKNIAETERLTRQYGGLIVLDTNLLLKPGTRPSQRGEWVRAHATAPALTFPGRYADWPSRWLDGNSDIKLYELRALTSPLRTGPASGFPRKRDTRPPPFLFRLDPIAPYKN